MILRYVTFLSTVFTSFSVLVLFCTVVFLRRVTFLSTVFTSFPVLLSIEAKRWVHMRSCMVQSSLFNSSPFDMLGMVCVELETMVIKSWRIKLIFSSSLSMGLPHFTGKNLTVFKLRMPLVTKIFGCSSESKTSFIMFIPRFRVLAVTCVLVLIPAEDNGVLLKSNCPLIIV